MDMNGEQLQIIELVEKDVRIVMENLVVKIEIEIKQKRQVKYRLKLENIYDKCPELMKEWNWEKNMINSY